VVAGARPKYTGITVCILEDGSTFQRETTSETIVSPTECSGWRPPCGGALILVWLALTHICKWSCQSIGKQVTEIACIFQVYNAQSCLEDK